MEPKSIRIYPDIIIHKRNTGENLLIMEIKTRQRNVKHDEEKLRKLTGGEYRYGWGLFIKFNGIKQQDLKWYKNGKRFRF